MTQTSWKGVVLEEKLIADIGRTEPHFAKTLSFLRTRTDLLVDGYAKLYLLPEGAEKPGRPAASKEDELVSILERFEEEGEQNASAVEPTVYEVTLDRAEGSLVGTLNIALLSLNPDGTSPVLVLNLMKAEKGRWRVSGWETRPAK